MRCSSSSRFKMEVSSRLTSYNNPNVFACSGNVASNVCGTGSASPASGSAATLVISSMCSDEPANPVANIEYALFGLDSREAFWSQAEAARFERYQVAARHFGILGFFLQEAQHWFARTLHPSIKLRKVRCLASAEASCWFTLAALENS